MAETKLSFSDALNKIKSYVKASTFDISEAEADILNKAFPPRYLLEMYFINNHQLPKFVNQYINYDYTIHFKLTVVEAIQLLRSFNETSPLYEPSYPKKSSKDGFKKKVDTLQDKYKQGIGKPELEIFMLAADKKDEHTQSTIYKTSKRALKKLAKCDESLEIPTKKIYDSYKDFLIKSLLSKEKNDTCSQCKLFNNNTQYLESNIPFDLNDNHVDLLILSDKPHNGSILKPDSYKILKQYLEHYQLDKLNYVISNVVLCEKDDKLSKEDISNCKPSIDKLIKECKPTAILALGSTVCDRLGVDGKGIVNSSGSKAEYDGYEVIKSIHPSYLVRNQTNDAYSLFGQVMEEIRALIFPPDEQESLNNGRKRPGDIISDSHVYAAKPLPKKFYKSEWVLINAFRDGFKSINHVFRNVKTNEKLERKVSCNNYEYYYILKDVNGLSKPFANMKDVVCKKGPWKFGPDKDIIERFGRSVLYEGNVGLDVKATVDYHYHSKPESEYLPQVFRYDIEHDMTGFKGTDISAPYKVTYISAEFNNEYYIWILDSEEVVYNKQSTYKDNNGEIRPLIINEFAGDESSLLQHFWYTLFVTCDPDVMTAWNGDGFDFPYMINRSKRLPYKFNKAFKHSSHEGASNVIEILAMMGKEYNLAEPDAWDNHRLTGMLVTDLMLMYDSQHQGELEKTSLDYVLNLEFEELHKKPFPAADASKEEWVEYNLWDTEAMKLIDDKVQASNYKFSLTKITNTTWHSSDYAGGIVDGLLLNFAKNTNIVLRTYKDPSIFTNKFLNAIIGGFTQVNHGGLKTLLVDYDAKSMYPSIMLTFNIGPNTLRLTIPPKDAYDIMVNRHDKDKIVEVYKAELECIRGLQHPVEKMTLGQVAKIIKDNNYIITPSGAIYCSIEEEKSLFHDILVGLGSNRDIAKGSMYDKDGNLIIAKYNRQLALKISANAFYGVYLFKKFMYFNTSIGGSITMTGRVFIKAVMHMIEVKYGHSDYSISQAMDAIVVEKQQDLWFKSSIYADTDGCVITFEDIIDADLLLPKQLDLVEKEIKDLNIFIIDAVDQIYPFFNKGEYMRLMKFKEDWVADKGLFYDSVHKRYALHIVRENGKDKDELFFRGIQIRSASTPRIVKDGLSELLDIVLRKKSFNIDELFEKIEEIENKLYDSCASGSLAMGKSVKYGKVLSTYKKPPYQVLAMELWNALHKREDFKVASKGLFFEIQHIDFYRLMDEYGLTEDEINTIEKNFKRNGIVIPQDQEKVPDYITINAKLTVEKRFIVPYTSILGPIIEQSSVSDMAIIDFL